MRTFQLESHGIAEGAQELCPPRLANGNVLEVVHVELEDSGVGEVPDKLPEQRPSSFWVLALAAILEKLQLQHCHVRRRRCQGESALGALVPEVP